MYWGSSSRLGSERRPLRGSSVTRYWSMIHSSAERLPRRYSKASGGILARVREGLLKGLLISSEIAHLACHPRGEGLLETISSLAQGVVQVPTVR